LPGNLRRSYGELTYISACSLFLIASVTVLVGIEGTAARSAVSHSIRLWPTAPTQCLRYLGNFAYATSCQPVVCEAHLSSTPESKGHFRDVMWAASVAGGALLATMAIAGCAAFGDGVSSNVLMSFRPGPISAIAYSLVVMHLCAYIPNDFIIMRFYLFKIFDVNILQVPTIQFITVTVLLFAVPVLAMAMIPLQDVSGAFELVLSLTGDLPTGFNCFLLPGLVYLSTFREHTPSQAMRVAAVLTVVLGSVCMLICPLTDIFAFASSTAEGHVPSRPIIHNVTRWGATSSVH